MPRVKESTSVSKVLAFNCSPRMENGNTALILNPFIDGMKDSGATVELLYTSKLKILPCKGEFSCWSGKNPGICIQNDDCPEVLEKMRNAEAWVFGIPVHAKLPGELQNLFNRTMPLLEPPPVARGRSIVPSIRKGLRLKQVGLVSTCSYWGLENFDLLIRQVEFMAFAFGVSLRRPVLRPQADLMSEGLPEGFDNASIMAAARSAGREFISKGQVSLQTAKAVQTPFMSRKQFLGQ